MKPRINLYTKSGKRFAWITAALKHLRRECHHYTYCMGAIREPERYRGYRRVCAERYAELRGWDIPKEAHDAMG